jgi:hypothetical protein
MAATTVAATAAISDLAEFEVIMLTSVELGGKVCRLRSNFDEFISSG